MNEPRFLPLPSRPPSTPAQALASARDFYAELAQRRTVRHFSDRPVERALIEACLLCAGTAPSGAHRQPWHFVAVGDPRLKTRIRQAAEVEEREFYAHRAPPEWLEALRPLGTDADKPFLERAPWLIAVFEARQDPTPDGRLTKNYYSGESVGIATGLLIAALHRAGLASLTHTPSPMGFLNQILERPTREKAFLLLVVGHPAPDARVPDLQRKPLEAIATFLDRSQRGALPGGGPSRSEA